MASRIKSYEINYLINTNAGAAVGAFQELESVISRLSGRDKTTNMARGLTALKGEISAITKDVAAIKRTFSEIQPMIDMSAFKEQLAIMQRAVAEFASQTRNIMRAAMSGTDKQFAAAKTAMGKDIFNAAKIQQYRDELTKLPQQIANTQKKLDKLRAQQAKSEEDHSKTLLSARGDRAKQMIAASENELKVARKNVQDTEKELNRLQQRQTSIASILGKINETAPAVIQRTSATPKPSKPSGWLSDKQMMALKRSITAPLSYGEDYNQLMTGKGARMSRYNQALQIRKDYMNQVREWRKSLSKATTVEGIKGGATPAVLGMSPQFLEQAFTGKLTLIPDIVSAKESIAGQTFNANLKLVPMLTDLKTALNKETYTIKVTPTIATSGKGKGAAKTQFANQLSEEMKKSNMTTGVKLDRTGVLERAKSGFKTMQTLANRHPVTFKMANDGSGGFALNQALTRLSELAKTRPVPFRMIHDGSGGFALNQALARMTELAKLRPIPFKMIHDGTGGFSLNQALARLQALAKSRPIAIESVVGDPKKGGKAATKRAGGTKPLNVNIKSTGVDYKVNALERLRAVWSELPRTGSRTYTVNLKTTGLENIANLERLIRLVEKLPASTRRTYNVSSKVAENTQPVGGNTTVYGTVGGRSRMPGRGVDFYTNVRKHAYPFTGNTSFGAREPAAIGMMKGMGMMMGVGGAMSVVGSSFSDAVRYQNTMETAKAILRDNYKGGNFNNDYNSMVRTVRDVAMRTKFTAPEAADAARFMAMAGLDIPAIKSAIAPIADVAAISDTDLGLVADKMTNIMTEFKVDPGRMRNLADMMTKTFTSTNTDMMMLAESLQYAGPMAFASGQNLSEVLAMIGIMGNSGIQASMAGTTMRMMLQNIYNPNKNQAAFMEKIGLRNKNADGSRRSLIDILSDVARITGKDDAKNVVGNLLSGKDGKSGIDTFEAASKLFRVTAAAGGASLLANMPQVRALVGKIQGTSGNSAAISLAKQNTVAGLWAQAKSAFTEAVVKVFEDNDMQSYLKNTLGSIIEYLKQPEFIKTIRDVLDLVRSIVEKLGFFVKVWLKIYQTFPNVTKFVLVAQMALTQLGYLMTPFVQLIGLISTLGNVIRGVVGIGAAGGIMSSGIAGRMMSSGIAASAMGRATSRKFIAANIASQTLGGTIGERMIAGHHAAIIRAERLKWRLGNTSYGTAAPGAFWAMAYTNPERVARRSRAAIRAEQMAARHASHIRNIRGAVAETAMMAWAAKQTSGLRSMDVFNRYERIYGHAYRSGFRGRAGVAFSRSFNAATNAMNFSNLWKNLLGGLKSGLISVVRVFATALGALTSPIGLAVLAIGGLAAALYAGKKKIENANEELENKMRRDKPYVEKSNKTGAASPYSLFWGDGKGTSIHDALIKANNGLKVNPMLSHLSGVSGIFSEHGITDSYAYNKKIYAEHIAPFAKYIFGKNMSYNDLLPLTEEMSENYGNITKGHDFYKYGMQAAVIRAAFLDPRASSQINRANSLSTSWLSLPENEREAAFANAIRKMEGIRGSFSNLKGRERLFNLGDLSGVRMSRALESYEGQQAVFRRLSEIIDVTKAMHTIASNNNIGYRDEAINNLLNRFAQDNGIPLSFTNMKPDWDKLYLRLDAMGEKYSNTELERKTILELLYERLMNIPGIGEILKNVIDINSQIQYERMNPYQDFMDKFGPGANWGLDNIPKLQFVDQNGNVILTPFVNGNDKGKGTNNTNPGPRPSPLAPVDNGYKFGNWGQTSYNNSDLNEGYKNTYASNSRSGQGAKTINLTVNTGGIVVSDGSNTREFANKIGNTVKEAIYIVKDDIGNFV